jgi:hypothetical protein
MPAPSWGMGVSTDVYKNPGHSQLSRSTLKFKPIDETGNTRVFLHGNDAYTFNPNHALHHDVQTHLGLDDSRIPLSIYHNHKDAEIEVTDNSKRTKWHHSPEVRAAILNHPWIKKTFPGEKNVSYYDEAIDGPWHEMK